ncbi:hypothetical protein FKW77_009346 [Venturia effusa]|uniref:Uncharacterized protein n=1 Tax=Venturia effusa TaxID=50376 RepID=A0A517L816_9PEZI|nr:hypothetical protein FKW77_009346 [Venturia effusa]
MPTRFPFTHAFWLAALLLIMAATSMSVPNPAITDSPTLTSLSERDVQVTYTMPLWITDSKGSSVLGATTVDWPLAPAPPAPVVSGCAVPFSNVPGVIDASGAKEFIKDQFDIWAESPDSEHHFANWYFRKWLPGTALESARCGDGFSCTVGSLENIKQGESCSTTRKAYYGGQILATIDHRHTVINQALQETLLHADAIKEDWLTLFSEKDTVNREKQWNEYMERKKFTLISQILMTFSGLLGGFQLDGEPIPGAQSLKLVVNALIFKNAMLGLDASKPGWQRWEQEAEIREVLKDMLEGLEVVVNNSHEDLLRGKADLAGKFIWQHAAEFEEVGSNNLLAETRRRFANSVNAPMLDHMWREDSVYITQSIAGTTRWGQTCAEDSRGPSQSKVCLDEFPLKVFYVFQYSRLKGAPIMLPKGLERINYLRGDMSIENIVRASVTHYNHAGFGLPKWNDQKHVLIADPFGDYHEADEPDYADKLVASHNAYHANESIVRSGGPLAGLIHLPIARCDGGECISGGAYDGWHGERSGQKVKATKGFSDKNYPCMVGPYETWDPADQPTPEEASIQGYFLTAANMDESIYIPLRFPGAHVPKLGAKIMHPMKKCESYMQFGKWVHPRKRPKWWEKYEKPNLDEAEAQARKRYEDKKAREARQAQSRRAALDAAVKKAKAAFKALDEKEKGVLNNGITRPYFDSSFGTPVA